MAPAPRLRGLRAGFPTLILWAAADRQTWGANIKRLHVGAAWRFSPKTTESLFVDMRQILASDCVAGAREVAATAYLLEDFARASRVGATGGGIWRGTAAQ